MRRTLGRFVHLAVPRFGAWAAVTIVDGAHARQVGCGPDGPFERTVRLRSLDSGVRTIVDDATGGRLGSAPATPPVLTALGAAADVAARLSCAGARVTALPFSTQGADAAVLVVAGPHAPDPAELDAFAHRGAVAMSSAFVFEEHAALASTLRAALRPAPLPHVSGMDLGASYRPAQETTRIGGDFYDVTPRSDGRWAISIGDVCGKGVEAAVLTGRVRQTLRAGGLADDDPAAALHLVNDSMLAAGGEQYVTLVHALAHRDGDRVRLRLAAGGHPPPLLLRGGNVTTVPIRGTIVGMLPEVSFGVADVDLAPGDLLLLYTDGVNEARGPLGMLGVEPLERLLADCDDLPAQTVTERLMQLALEHLDGRDHDDIALLAVRCTP